MSKHEFTPGVRVMYGENPWMNYHDMGIPPYSQYPRIKMEYSNMKALPELERVADRPLLGFSSQQKIMRKVIGKPSPGRHRKNDEEE